VRRSRSGVTQWLGGHPRRPATLLFLLFLLIHLPMRSAYLVNWDSVNFALGLDEFDLAHHQPHPPGYIGYIVLGRLLRTITGDANSALTLLSTIAGAAAPAALYLLCRRLMKPASALTVAILFGTSPVVWYYSEVGLTYIVEATGAILLAGACFEARSRGSARHLFIAAVLLAGLGAIRQTTTVLLLPICVFAAWNFPRRTKLAATAIAMGTAAVWLVPLIYMAGGPSEYLALSRQLAGLTGGRTWIGAINGTGMIQNFGYVALGWVLGLGLAFLIFPVALLYRRPEWNKDASSLLAWWCVVPTVVFLLVHTGQLGYVLLVLPAGYVAAGRRIDQITGGERTPVGVRHRYVAATASAVAINVVIFFALPPTSLALVRSQPDQPGASTTEADVRPREIVALAVRQLDIPANDRHWDGVIDLIERFDPEQAIVLAEPLNRGSFRHIAYYLPDFVTYGIGYDRAGGYGVLFTAHDGTTDYSIDGLDSSEPSILIPSGVDVVIIPDRPIRKLLESQLAITEVRLAGGDYVGVARVDPNTELVLNREELVLNRGRSMPRPR